MPGIVGIIRAGPAAERKTMLARMVKCMMHESFYASGTLQVDALDAGVGWVCHKGSFSDCMPAWNETRDVCLIFSGEHFADVTEAQGLKAAGHHCSKSTAAYLVHLYEEYGGKFFEMLNGTFHGVVIDLRENKVVLFNDRYGLGRIYYHESPDGFYFSAEAKALLKALPQLRSLDMRSFGEFFSCGCALQNRSLFEGVSLLPPGSMWTFRRGQAVRKETYFNRETWENLPPLSAEDYYQRLRGTFVGVLPRYFAGRQSVGLSLTGGLDSRMIVAHAYHEPYKLQCYTFGGIYRDPADVKIARKIADVCQQYHETITIRNKFFTEFPSLARQTVYCTDGACDVMAAAGFSVNRLAREIAPVRLTGNYGDEILRGNMPFKAAPPDKHIFSPEFLSSVQAAEAAFAGEKRVGRASFIAFKQVPWHHYGRFALEQLQFTVRTPYLDNALVALAFQAPPDPDVNRDFAHRLIFDGNPALSALPTDRGIVWRGRFTDNRFKAFCREFMPRAEYVYDYGMPQWLAKVDRVLAPLHLERLFLGRQKYYHFRIWYRHELARHLKEVLLDSSTLRRPYLNGRRVEEIVAAHTRGTGNYTLELHKLMTSELIQRELIEKI
jgi:asparagine synthase (glutamine-hydrolysing)